LLLGDTIGVTSVTTAIAFADPIDVIIAKKVESTAIDILFCQKE
jgi:hypothetical protein